MHHQPPAWAQSLLRLLLEPRHRETIPGDLLEDYRERLLNGTQCAAATAWYIRQVFSFVTARSLCRLLLPGSSGWIAAVAALQFVILVAAPVWAGIEPGWALFSLGAVALAGAGLCALAAAPERRIVVRVSTLWLPVVTASLVILNVQAFSPVPGVVTFFCCVPAAAFHAAARSGRLSLGIAAGTVVGSAMVLFAFAVSTILRYPHPPFLAVPFGCGVAAMLGAIGGLFGREFSPVSSPEPELLSIVS
jgi:hypothetical protein